MKASAISDSPLAALRRYARARVVTESCDFCSAALSGAHEHLFQPEQRLLSCVCGACAILFGNQREAKYRRVPRRIRLLKDFRLTGEQWRSLLIPIQLAFIFQDGKTQRPIALYPSPAGAAESWLDTASWDEIVALNSVLQRMEPDVEALLINRMVGIEGDEYYVSPIDECFRLAGLLRAHWRGLSGGARVREEIAHFFQELKKKAFVSEEELCARSRF
jgi:hypothetical protein